MPTFHFKQSTGGKKRSMKTKEERERTNFN